MVIRSIRGYLNWHSLRGPKATRSFTLILPEEGVGYHKLMPGGRYYVFQTGDGGFHCYDTQRQIKCWSYRGVTNAIMYMRSMDCAVVDDETAVILAFIIQKFSDIQGTFVVIRLDLQSGDSETVLSTLLPLIPPQIHKQFSIMSEQSRVKIANEIVAAWTPGNFVVGNWRTGDLAVIEELGIVDSIHIIKNHLLCAINQGSRGYVYAAAPISRMFAETKKLGTNGNEPHLSASLRSLDVFTIVAPLAIPDYNGRTASTSVQSISVCLSSWKRPTVCEFDDQAASTRIVLSLQLFFGPDENFLITFQLQFAPNSILPPTNACLTIGDGESDYILTCQRQSPLYSYDEDFSDRSPLTSAARTGRAFASPIVESMYTVTRDVYSLNMYDFFKRAAHGPDDDDVVPIANVMHKLDISRLTDDLINDHDVVPFELMAEEYSGALWYRRGKTLFIHYFD